MNNRKTPKTGHNEDSCETYLMSHIANLQQILSPNVTVDCNQVNTEDIVNLSVIKNASYFCQKLVSWMVTAWDTSFRQKYPKLRCHVVY